MGSNDRLPNKSFIEPETQNGRGVRPGLAQFCLALSLWQFSIYEITHPIRWERSNTMSDFFAITSPAWIGCGIDAL